MTTRLSDSEIQTQLAALPGWSLDDKGQLTRRFKRANFVDGFAFVQKIVPLAEAAGHHPDVLVTYPAVTISLTTHDAGGLTQKDFDLARQIDVLV